MTFFTVMRHFMQLQIQNVNPYPSAATIAIIVLSASWFSKNVVAIFTNASIYSSVLFK
jgi:hypothetical protein